jgi:hypothetical protein
VSASETDSGLSHRPPIHSRFSELSAKKNFRDRCAAKVDLGGKVIRRILIFDNHPDSLRLVSELHVRPDDLAATRRAHPVYLIFALLLMLALSIAMFWPLIMRCHSL